jgi:hypothetical protein
MWCRVGKPDSGPKDRRCELGIFGGGERTRTADFHVANVFTADFGGLRRTVTAGQRVIHTLANGGERRRPRDIRGMSGVGSHWPRVAPITRRRSSERSTQDVQRCRTSTIELCMRSHMSFVC